jgi:hypothetical protein
LEMQSRQDHSSVLLPVVETIRFQSNWLNWSAIILI